MSYRDRHGDEEYWGAWRPILGIIVALVLLLAMAGGAHQSAPPGGARSLGFLVGYSGSAILIFYGLTWAFALRRAHPAWRVIGFLLIAGLALLAGLVRTSTDWRMLRGEAGLIQNDMQAVLDGNQIAPAGPATTPSGVIRNLFAGLQANQREFDAKLTRAGIPNLLDPVKLKREPAILKDCGVTERLRPELAKHRGVAEAELAKARKSIEALPGNADVRGGMLEGFDQSMGDSRPRFERMWDLSDQGLVELGTMCRVLARRHWTASSTEMTFTSSRDLAEYNGAVTRYNAIYAEQTRLQSDAEARARAAMRNLDRYR